MTRIFWDTFFLISGSLFTFGAGQSSSGVIEASVSVDTNSTASPNTSARSSGTTSGRGAATTSLPAVKMVLPVTKTLQTFLLELVVTSPPFSSPGSFASFGSGQTNTSIIDVIISINATSGTAPNTSESSSSAKSSRSSATKRPVSTTTNRPVKKFVAAAVRSHFDDCPDSHQHFCFHGTCRFLILEDTPACVCHPGFAGMRCEHADLLAVVATNHRQQTVATVLVLCVIGCVLIMVLCSLLHCWWRRDCRRRSHEHHYVGEKHGASHYPLESMV